MKYAHFADLHLGSWREEKMRQLSTTAFLMAMDDCIKEKVDFILFSGDMFNTSLPSLDTLKIVTKKMKELHDLGIPIYAIAGSHDFSPSGKTMLDVLENAGLLVNVCKGSVDAESKRLMLRFTTDSKTGVKITGMVGRKGMMDRRYYENLSLEDLEREEGYKIFLFHTALTELKPKHLENIESQPASFLPKGFNYYAGGHIHHRTQVDLPDYGTLTYPGALFPNNFAEIEKYSHGGFYLISVEEGTQQIQWLPVEIVKHHALILHCSHQAPETVYTEIIEHLKLLPIANSLITLRVQGTLAKGKVSDINFKGMFQELYTQKAYFIMKNTAQLTSSEFEEIKMAEVNPEEVEEHIIKEHLQQSSLFDKETELRIIVNLLNILNTAKKEGETVITFQERISSEIEKQLML